jgi:predicted transposase/invertase (TIGR01784 family)
MKYDEVPTNYHSPYMVQVAEKLSILKMTPEERVRYSYYQKKLYNDRDELQAAEARGKTEENIRVKLEIAKNLLSQNIDINTISIATGLPVEKINELKS